jgi:ankyrin repeat protein
MRFFLTLILSLPLFAGVLHDAVLALDEDEAVRLLDKGADINDRDANGETVMHIATRIGRFSMVKTLLVYDPDLTIENNKGYTPLAIAIHHNHIKSIQALVKIQKRAKTEVRLSELHRVAVLGDVSRLEAVLDEHHQVDAPDAKGRTALQLAAREGHIGAVRFLIGRGANPNHVDKEGRNVLYFARYGGDKHVIEFIEQEIEKRGSK